MTAHQFKIKEPNGWSTYCRTDNTLHEDEVSHSDSHPPPEVLLSHICTFARGKAAFAPLHGIVASPCPPCPRAPSRLRRALVNVSTCQPVPSRKRLSPCPRANMSPSRPLVASRFSDPMVRPDPVFGVNNVHGLELLIKANKADPGAMGEGLLGLGPDRGSSSPGSSPSISSQGLSSKP